MKKYSLVALVLFSLLLPQYSHAERYANDPDPTKSFKIQAEWAAGSIKKHYKGDLESFAHRYAPVKGATNDVHKMNANWLPNMQSYMESSDGNGN